MYRTRHNRGFTIVELLIVIVVIAILAVITIVAYNGMQQRARNSQTIAAITAWAKALKLYEADNGTMPNTTGCLGLTYGYGPSGTDASGYQCRQDNASYGINVNASLNSLLAPYMNGAPPQPSTAGTYFLTSTLWYRGAYYYNTVPGRIDFVLEGASGTCPKIAGMSLVSQQNGSTNDVLRCALQFG